METVALAERASAGVNRQQHPLTSEWLQTRKDRQHCQSEWSLFPTSLHVQDISKRENAPFERRARQSETNPQRSQLRFTRPFAFLPPAPPASCVRNLGVNPAFNQPLSSRSYWAASLPSEAESVKNTADRFSGLPAFFPPPGRVWQFYAKGNNSSRGNSSADNF